MTVEQGDLFIETAREEEPQNTTKEKESELSPRCKALYRLIEHNSLVEVRKTSQKEICDKLAAYGYVYDKDEKSHDHCVMIWKDIKDNNESYEHEKVIISRDFEYWIGNKEETKEFINQLWNDLFPRLSRYWKYKKKIELDGQMKLLSTELNPIDEKSQAREFIESYGKERIS